MSVTGLESMKGDGMGVFARNNKLQVESTVVAGDAGDGAQGQVTGGRQKVLSLPDYSARTVSTDQYDVDDSTGVEIVGAEADTESITIQNHLAGSIGIEFGAGTPTADSFQIAAGATYTVPFPYAGAIQAKGMGSSVMGKVVVIRSKV